MQVSSCCVVAYCGAFLVAGLTADLHAEESEVLRESFDQNFDLQWTIIRPVDTHRSLETNPGEFTLTTHYGSIHGGTDPGALAKNLMLVDREFITDEDFVATLAVTEFAPEIYYQQVALLIYQGDDDYVKWSMEKSWQEGHKTNLVLVHERAGEPKHSFPTPKNIDGPFWLRVQRVGEEYTVAYSNDGDEFETIGTEAWTPANASSPVKVGFLAKNGGNDNASDIDVVIESFELAVLNPSESE